MYDSLNHWIAEQFPHVVGLAMLPFERTMHEEFCIKVGWPVCREDWYPETCFEVRFEEIGRRLVAVYDDSEFGVGLDSTWLARSPASMTSVCPRWLNSTKRSGQHWRALSPICSVQRLLAVPLPAR